MARQKVTTITLREDKVAEMRLPEGPTYTVRAHGYHPTHVREPRWSPLFGELWAPNVTAGTDQFLTVELLVAKLRVQIDWEILDYHAIGQRRWVMTNVADRLFDLRQDELARQRRLLRTTRRGMGRARSLEKIDAIDHISQAIDVLEPNDDAMRAAARQSELAAMDLRDRQQIAGRIAGISNAQQTSWTDRFEYDNRHANAVYELLTSSRLSATNAMSKLWRAAGGIGYDKPWSFVVRLQERMAEQGYNMGDRGFTRRLAESYGFEGTQGYCLRVIGTVLRESQPWLVTNAPQVINRLDRRIRLLGTYEPLEPTAVVIAHVTSAMRAIQNNLRLVLESQTTRANPKPAIMRAKTMADEARFWLRYRPYNDPNWHRVAA
ncbi:MAG TPA: hypothetical protein VLF41_01720 [Candidatus Nanoarchaeia archaeon]|nr:hypothetical protein [Candidatus Nanoarchaeia archaeon]